MSENYNIQIGVDASQAESGVKRFDTTLKSTINTLNTFDRTAAKAFESFSGSTKSINFSSLASQTAGFSRSSAKISSDLANASKSFSQFARAASSAMNEVSRAAGKVDFSKITAQTKAMTGALGTISTSANKAVTSINSIARAIGDLNTVMTGTGRRGTNSLSQALLGLNAVKIDPTLARNLRQLGTALDTIKAPSANTIRALAALGQLGTIRVPSGLGSALSQIGTGISAINAGSIAALRSLPAALAGLNAVRVAPSTVQALGMLGRSLSGITVPSGQGIALLRVLISTLGSARINPQTAQYLAQFSTALSGFRGPSPSAIVNTEKLLQVMGGANVANVTRIANALRQVQTSFARTGQSGAQAGSMMNSAFAQTFPRIARLQGEMRGLENTFSLSYNAASIFRTALGSLTMGQFVKQIGEAGMAAQSFRQSMMVVSASSTELQQHVDFINTLTQRLPISLEAARDSYKGFAAATLMAGLSVKDTQMIFENFSGAFSVLGLSTEKVKYAFLALQQIASKGRFSMEELKRQLGEQLPGTMQILADAMSRVRGQDISVEKLQKMVETGQLGVRELVEFGKQMGIVFGPQVSRSLDTPIAKLEQLRTAFTQFKQKIFDSGFDAGMATVFEQLTKGLNSDQIQAAAQKIGAAFKEIGVWVGALGRAALENIDTLAKFGAAITAWGAFTGIAAVMRSLISPMGLLGGAAVAAATGSNTLALALAGLGLASISVDILNSSLVRFMKQLAKFALVGEAAALGVKGIRSLFTNDDGSNAAEGLMQQFPRLGAFLQGTGNLADKFHETLTGVLADTADAAADPTKKLEELQGVWEKVKSSIEGGMDPAKAFGFMQKYLDDSRAASEKLGKVGEPTNEQWDDNGNRVLKQRQSLLQAITNDEQKLLDLVAPQKKAMEEYEAHLRAVNSLREAGQKGYPKGISEEQAAAYKAILDRKYLDKVDPTKAMVRDLNEELQALQKTGDARQLEQKFIQQRNALLEKGVVLTKEQEASLRAVNEAMLDLERGGANGFQRYANSVKDFRESLIDVEQNAIGSLSDALADLTSKGQADFKALGQSILRTFNKAIIDSLLKDMFSSFGDESPLAQLFGVGKKNNAGAAKGLLDQFGGLKGINTQIANIQAGVVNVNGLPGAGAPGTGLPGTTGAPSDWADKGTTAPVAPVTRQDLPALPAAPSAETTAAPSTAAAGAAAQETRLIASTPSSQVGLDNLSGTVMPYAKSASGEMVPLSTIPYLDMSAPSQAENAGLYGATVKPMESTSGLFDTASAMPQPFRFMPEGLDKYKLTTVPTPSVPLSQPPINPAEVDMMPTGSVPVAATMMRGNSVDPAWLQQHLRDRIADSKLNGFVPEDGARYGITTGSPEEWSNMMTRLAYHESGLNVKNVGDVGSFGTGSRGLFQLSQQDAVNWRMNGGRQFSIGQLEDPTTNADAAVKISERLVTRTGSVREGMGQYWGPFKKEGWTPGHGRDRALKLGEIPKQPASETPKVQATPVSPKPEEMRPSIDNVPRPVAPTETMPTQPTAPQAPSALGYRDALGGDLYGTRPISTGGVSQDVGGPLGGPAFMPQRPPTVLSPDIQSFGTSSTAMMQQQMMQQQAMMSNQMAQMTQPLQTASQTAMASFSQVGSSIAQAGSQASTSSGLFGSLGNSLEQMFSQLGNMGGGGGGGGGLFGGLFNLFGMFQEGGVSTAPVTALAAASSFRNMPRYAEGTDLAARAPGTPSMGGGFGAVLHDNEAVIPLTRGREVPVKLAGRGAPDGNTTIVHMTVNGVKDTAGFARSKTQIAADLSTSLQRAAQKQN